MKVQPNGLFDVGAIAKELQAKFGLAGKSTVTTDNNATPENLRVLLADLAKLTDAIVEKRNNLEATTSEILLPDVIGDDNPEAALPHWDRQMSKWRERLAEYQRIVDAAPVGDRKAVLWDVTAPLLLGLFGGEGGKLPRQTMDAFEPFALANGLNVASAWRQERLDLFLEDLKKGLEDLPKLIPWWVWALPVTAIGIAVASWVRRR